ncbi:DUF4417 domain-containing protein [Ellagibacter isourolithinifaciens]|uniref:DUF4417 domain-containing protein n=1 Tax=Ellagibacter isourolithinifaciens TaxID=2137581 RepID=UPI003A9448BC
MILISDSATYLYCKDGDFEATTMEDGTHRFTLKYQVGKNEKLTLTLNEAVVRRFGLEFKSKVLPYGAERLRADDAYNLGICSRTDCGRDGFPRILKASAKPNKLQGFNYAKSTPSDQKHGKGCHFFIDDYQFERLWQRPERYLDVLRGYDCVLTPDFSLYMDMPDDAAVEPLPQRGAGQGRARGLARRNARDHEAPGAVLRGGFFIARNEVRHADNQAPGHRVGRVQIREVGRAHPRPRVRPVGRARALAFVPVVQDSRYRPGRAERRAQRQAGAEADEGAAFSLVLQ